MKQFILYFISSLLFSFSSNYQAKASLDLLRPNLFTGETLPPCEACGALVKSFEKGIENTKRGKFEGGDTAWEEEKQKSYAKSEVRLTEIQEDLCKNIKKGDHQCHDLVVKLESEIEDWWFYHQDETDMHDYLCAKYCPKDEMSDNSQECTDSSDTCVNNDKCNESGNQEANGECVCDEGYTGSTCSDCVKGYYKAYKDDNKVLCSRCHNACAEGCKGAGSSKCEGECQNGWKKVGENGCTDINECLNSKKYCPGNQFCVNKEGNYTCLSCDRACDGCNGDGPDMCLKCAENYHKKENICINSDILGRKRHENMTRYATYFGLCVATCIILQRNIYIASTIGLVVGLYISVSEYMIANSDIQSATPNLDILDPLN